MSVFTNDPNELARLRTLWAEKPWTRPRPVGLEPSMGYGDRLGLASPGHRTAHREAGLAGKVVPLYSQQSAREMARTGRTPVQVMWDAVSILADDPSQGPHAADADHMKSEEHVRSCLEAGFTWFTADPSDLVRDDADDLSAEVVERDFADLLEKNPGRFDHYLETYAVDHSVGNIKVAGDEEAVKRVALKYGPALYQTREVESWVKAGWEGDEPFDFEISVDETSAPTSPLAHLVIARELSRLGVRLTSLAPRFVGEFQKGIDYIGDVEAFTQSLRTHVAIAKQEGPYKISVHSGSDKFSIYPILARECGSLLHLKTAGTSYLEALRVAARKAPQLFRDIAAYSAEVFEEQRATYHIKAVLENFPNPTQVEAGDLERAYLASPESDDPRQILHVGFGAVLMEESGTRFGDPLREVLTRESAEYEAVLATHFGRHLTAFE